MRVFTRMHLTSAKAMPRKAHPLWLGEKEDRKYRLRAKRARKVIARFYRFLRAHPDDGNAKVCHRYGVVSTGSEAATRLRLFQ